MATVLLHNSTVSRRLLSLATGLSVFLGVLLLNPAVSDRFLAEPGDRAVLIASTSQSSDEGIASTSQSSDEGSGNWYLNTNGRAEVWTALLGESLNSNAVWGNGTGYARDFVGSEFGWDHPHSSFVRILADHGYVGLVLFLTTGFWVLGFCLRKVSKLPSEGFVGFASVVAMGLMAIVEEPFGSFGVLLPLTLVLGATLGKFTSSSVMLRRS